MSRYSIDISTKVDFGELDKAEAKIKSLQSLGKNGINLKINSNGLENIATQAQNIGKQASASFGKGFKFKLDTKGVDADLSQLNSKLKKFSTLAMSDSQKQSLASTKETLSSLKSMLASMKTSNSFNDDDIRKFISSLKTAQNEVKILSNDLSSMSTNEQRLKLVGNMEKWLEKNTKATKSARKEVKGYIDYVNKQGSSLTSGAFKEVAQNFNSVNSKMMAQGKLGSSFISETGRAFKAIAQFAYTYGIIQDVFNKVGDAVKELREVDTILTEISKTSDLTDSQLKQLGETSFESASKFGKKASEYLIGVQEMSRSGFVGKQAEELAQLSILGQAAGDMSTDVSNAYLLATNAAYGYQGSVQKLNDVLDGQNMITNRNSVSMQDMAEATSKAASMASETGVQVDELSAIIGTAVARTKQDGNVIGTALKSLFVNLQDTSNKKIVAAFDSLGISQKKYVDGVEQLKTPIELLRELADAYNALPDGSALKADTLRAIGNKRQANVLAAILQGIGNGDFDKMLSDYSQGKGSAMTEAMKSANNWEGSLAKLSNAWTSFIGNFANTDLIIGATNALAGLLNTLNNFTNNPLMAAGAVGGGLGLFKIFKNLDKPKKHWVSLFSYIKISESSLHKKYKIMALYFKCGSMISSVLFTV